MFSMAKHTFSAVENMQNIKMRKCPLSKALQNPLYTKVKNIYTHPHGKQKVIMWLLSMIYLAWKAMRS